MEITNLTIKRLSPEEVKANEEFFSKSDKSLLKKASLTQEDLWNLFIFKNRYMDYYTPHLIAKTFIQFKDNMDELMVLEEEFRQLKIITPFNRLHVQTLDELLKLMDLKNGIKAEAEKFYNDFYKDMKDDYCFGKILFQFKQSKAKKKIA